MAVNRAAAWGVHLYTASGLIFALLAAIEICAPHPDARIAFVWLMVAVLIDATDGPLARRFDVKTLVPQIDGRKIDDIVDYLTFTFLPLLLIARMEWVPEPAVLWLAPAMIASVLGFANVAAKDESGGFFLGFPSYWNIVAFYAGIIAQRFGVWPNAFLLLVLAALTVAPIGFIYPNLAPAKWKTLILGGAVLWLVILIAMLWDYPSPPVWLVFVSLIYPAFYTIVSIYEYRRRKAAG
ncbi:MAG: phosphatidylcholine synthase [Thermoanaerobaculia bacterium]|nr:phosphatidylcholine synthase [Thermoanaerobaculia bacterium]